MKTEKVSKQFPRSFRSSSAAYRSIYQFESKIGTVSGLIMTKIGDKNFLVSKPVRMSVEEFYNTLPNVTYPEGTFRHYPDGLMDMGYYELKTGDRRRPNSKFIPTDTVYVDFINSICD